MTLHLSPLKKDLEAIVALLDGGEYETAEGLARAIWDTALVAVQARTAWTVVGQLKRKPRLEDITPEEREASRVCLGYYATRAVAEHAAESLRLSVATGEEFLAWVVPVIHGSAADAYRNRSKAAAGADEVPSQWQRVGDRWQRVPRAS